MTPTPKQGSGRTAGSARLEVRGLEVWYGAKQALREVHLTLEPGSILALIGPSGCGKSTFIRVLNRMLDEEPEVRVRGEVLLDGVDILAPGVDVLALRRRVGLVQARPAPFPMSVYDNVAWGLRRHGDAANLEGRVEQALRRADLWKEVSGRLRAPAASLDLGQQQRLCLARTLALEPEVLLLDEVTAALDPVDTARVEELLGDLRGQSTVVIVTHNIQQASRVSDLTGFFHQGELVEVGDTATLFTRPRRRKTEDYITGRYG